MALCFVLTCPNRRRGAGDRHFFTAPKKVGPKWKEIMEKVRPGTAFDPSNKSHRICSLHFREDEIIRQNKITMNGNELYFDRRKWALKEDAIPSIFADLAPENPVPVKPKRNPLTLKNADNAEHQNQQRAIKVKSYSRQQKPTKIMDPNGGESGWNDENAGSNADELNNIPNTSSHPAFDILKWWKSRSSDFPSWLLDPNQQDKTSLLKISYTSGRPEVQKSVVINGEKISVFLGELNATDDISMPNEELSSTTLSIILTQVDNFWRCQGVKGFADMDAPKGIKVNDTWFSRECERIGTNIVCVHCKRMYAGLYGRLRQKKKKIVPNKIVSTNRKITKYYKARARKLFLERQKMRKEVMKMKSIICSLNVEDIISKVSRMDMHASMKDAVIHSLKSAKVSSAKGNRYDRHWLLECLLLRIKSPSAYRHLRNSKVLPLPSISTLRKMIVSQKCGYGFNTTSMSAIQKCYKDKGRRDRQGVLMFDEIQLRETIEFNSSTHKFDGYVDFGELSEELADKSTNQLANHALVIMYRPMNDAWVQPVAAFATKNAAKGTELQKIVMDAVLRLESIGAEVLAIVCDGSKPNKCFWRLCGIEGGSTILNKIVHPSDDDRFLFFTSDTPHIFKCIRNHMQKYKIIEFQGEDIDFGYYEKLYIEDGRRSCGLRKCPKLTKAHISPNPFEKMVVRFATQLFSRSVATGLNFYRSSHVSDFMYSEATEKFTLLLNDVFDALNARLPEEGLRMNSTKYKVLESFLKLLDNEITEGTTSTISHVPFASKETFLGLRVTIKSTLEIIDYLTEKLGFLYVLTGKINQDALERFFGIVRGAGGREDHPTVINFAQIFRILSLYNPIKQELKGNISSDDGSCLLVSAYNDSALDFGDRSGQVDQNQEVEDTLIARLLEAQDRADVSTPKIPMAQNELLDKNIVYYLAGYLCFKSPKLLTCTLCSASLSVNQPNVDHSLQTLTNILNRGPLHHPDKNLFQIVLDVEKAICETLNDESFYGDMIVSCMEKICFTNIPELGCGNDGHSDIILLKLIPYYIVIRMHFYAKSRKIVLAQGKATKNKRKESKLVST